MFRTVIFVLLQGKVAIVTAPVDSSFDTVGGILKNTALNRRACEIAPLK